MTLAFVLRGNKIYPVDHFERGEMSIIAGDAFLTGRTILWSPFLVVSLK